MITVKVNDSQVLDVLGKLAARAKNMRPAFLEIGEDISPLLLKLANLIGGLLPNLSTQKLDVKLISRDPAEVEKYKIDPLNYIGGTKAGLAKAILNRIGELKPKYEFFNYPALIMHGSADKITNIKGSKELFESAKSTDKSLKIWDGAYHEIFNETNKIEVIKYMCDWIEKRN